MKQHNRMIYIHSSEAIRGHPIFIEWLYRVNSHRAIEFRKWATQILHEYIIKGFTIDEERLKQMKHFGQDYFDEMLERIREIRLSERDQKITDIYALPADYDSLAEITQHFFATVQNKLHWAITGKTLPRLFIAKPMPQNCIWV